MNATLQGPQERFGTVSQPRFSPTTRTPPTDDLPTNCTPFVSIFKLKCKHPEIDMLLLANSVPLLPSIDFET